MTYCLGIITKYGLVLASDSRTNAGSDQVNTTRKMHTFTKPGEHAFVLLTAGSLSCSQSVLTLLRRAYEKGEGLASVTNMYDAARVVGKAVREVDHLDRAALVRDDYTFNVSLILGGQIKGEEPQLFMIYPQGNPLQASDESPFLQIGEAKYGRPILDRGIRFDETTLEEATKYAILSLDSTMKSNVTVGPPIDVLVYSTDELDVRRHRRFDADDPALTKMRVRWDQALRQAVCKLPEIRFRATPTATLSESDDDGHDSIEVVDNSGFDATDPQTQMGSPRGKRGRI